MGRRRIRKYPSYHIEYMRSIYADRMMAMFNALRHGTVRDARGVARQLNLPEDIIRRIIRMWYDEQMDELEAGYSTDGSG